MTRSPTRNWTKSFTPSSVLGFYSWHSKTNPSSSRPRFVCEDGIQSPPNGVNALASCLPSPTVILLPSRRSAGSGGRPGGASGLPFCRRAGGAAVERVGDSVLVGGREVRRRPRRRAPALGLRPRGPDPGWDPRQPYGAPVGRPPPQRPLRSPPAGPRRLHGAPKRISPGELFLRRDPRRLVLPRKGITSQPRQQQLHWRYLACVQ